MYVPKLFQEHDWLEIRKIILDHSFGTIITCDDGVPVATHAPLQLVEAESKPPKLQGHFSRANPHWRLFESQPKTLVIFSGPHSYVSPRWYDHVNVPTWNYIAVHLYGTPRLVTDDAELHQLMAGLVDRYEGHGEAAGRYSLETLPAEFRESQMRGIVCFEITVEEIQSSFKLSQNRNDASYHNVIEQLSKSDDQSAQGVAQAMTARRKQPL